MVATDNFAQSGDQRAPRKRPTTVIARVRRSPELRDPETPI